MYGRPVFGSKLETEDWEAVQKIDSSKDRVKPITTFSASYEGTEANCTNGSRQDTLKK